MQLKGVEPVLPSNQDRVLAAALSTVRRVATHSRKLRADSRGDLLFSEQLDLHHGGGELIKLPCLQLLQGVLHNSPYYDMAVERIVELHGVRILIVCLGESYVLLCARVCFRLRLVAHLCVLRYALDLRCGFIHI